MLSITFCVLLCCIIIITSCLSCAVALCLCCFVAPLSLPCVCVAPSPCVYVAPSPCVYTIIVCLHCVSSCLCIASSLCVYAITLCFVVSSPYVYIAPLPYVCAIALCLCCTITLCLHCIITLCTCHRHQFVFMLSPCDYVVPLPSPHVCVAPSPLEDYLKVYIPNAITSIFHTIVNHCCLRMTQIAITNQTTWAWSSCHSITIIGHHHCHSRRTQGDFHSLPYPFSLSIWVNASYSGHGAT